MVIRELLHCFVFQLISGSFNVNVSGVEIDHSLLSLLFSHHI